MQRYNKYTTPTNLPPFIFLIRFLFNIFYRYNSKILCSHHQKAKYKLFIRRKATKKRFSVSLFQTYFYVFLLQQQALYLYIYLYNYIYKYIIYYLIRWSKPICFDWNGETLKRFAVLFDGSFATRMANAPLVLNRKTVWKKSTKELAHSKGLPIFAE